MIHTERRSVDLSGINVIEMHVRPTLDIVSTRHNISGAGLRTPLKVGTIVIKVTKATMRAQCLDDLCIGGLNVVVVL